MNHTTAPPLTPDALITRTLTVRTGQRTAGEAAALRHGLLAATEAHARAYTDIFLAGESERSATGWRRAAAICASATGAPQTGRDNRIPLGASLRALFNRENPGRTPHADNAIVAQVNALPMFDVENAAATLALLTGRCANHAIPIDFYALGHVLSRWGRGTNSRSRAIRNQIVSDFYRYIPSAGKGAHS